MCSVFWANCSANNLFPFHLLGNDGPLVKKPTIDNYSQPGNVTIPPVGTADPQVIAQAAIAK